MNYQNKCRLIRGWDDLFNKVKEHINSVSAMKLSPYYKVCIVNDLPYTIECFVTEPNKFIVVWVCVLSFFWGGFLPVVVGL